MLIRDWREAWGQGDFPFLFVQLPNFNLRVDGWKGVVIERDPGESEWAELREAQALALSEPNTGMVVTTDIGDPNNIHPANKRDVGKRLARIALAREYRQPVQHSGPVFRAASFEGSRVRIEFDHVESGLVFQKGRKGFAIAGPDSHFIWAHATIEGDTVIVWHEDVPKPIAVRYNWANNPKGKLFNEAGLPAAPFRTDNWPGQTIEAR